MAIIGSASYGLNPLFALPLYGIGVTPLCVLFYRYGISVVMLFVWMLLRKESFRLTRKELLPVLAMGILFAASSATLFFSFKFIDAGLASVILFTYPMFVVLLSWLVFHEKVSKVALLCIAVAFGGICLLNQSDSAGDGASTSMSIIGMLLAVASGFVYAIYLVGVGRSVLRTMPAVKLTFYALVTGTVMFFIANRCGADLIILPNAKAWCDATGLALFPTIISLLLVTKSIHIIGSTPASLIGALEPITALLVSLAVFGGTLSARNVIGIFFVLGAVLLMVYSNRK